MECGAELWELVGRTAGEEVGEEKEIFLGTHFGLGAGESAKYFLPASLALLVLDLVVVLLCQLLRVLPDVLSVVKGDLKLGLRDRGGSRGDLGRHLSQDRLLC